jgi:hypothetical protein
MARPLHPDETAAATPERDVLHRLSTLDRFLPLWIGAAMVLGLVLGRMRKLPHEIVLPSQEEILVKQGGRECSERSADRVY